MNTLEAMKKALHAWENGLGHLAKDLLKTAIQQVEKQEPVAWAYCPECGSFDVRYEEGRHKQCASCFQEWFSDVDYSDVVQQNLNRLYAAPVRTKDLTDEDLCKIGEAHALGMECEGYENNMLWYEVNPLPAFRAVIAAYKEKNK